MARLQGAARLGAHAREAPGARFQPSAGRRVDGDSVRLSPTRGPHLCDRRIDPGRLDRSGRRSTRPSSGDDGLAGEEPFDADRRASPGSVSALGFLSLEGPGGARREAGLAQDPVTRPSLQTSTARGARRWRSKSPRASSRDHVYRRNRGSRTTTPPRATRPRLTGAAARYPRVQSRRASTCSPPSRSPRATRTRSATRSPTASSTPCSPRTRGTGRLREPGQHRPGRRRRRDHHRDLRRHPDRSPATRSARSATTAPSTDSTPRPAPCSPRSTSSRPTSPRASTPAYEAARATPPTRTSRRRRRPGNDVRLRDA